MKRAVFILGLAAVAQTLPRSAAVLEFTLIDAKGLSRLSDHKGRTVVLYLFSPN